MTAHSSIITTFINQVPVADQTPAYKIFHHEFDAAVPHMFVYTEEFMRNSGMAMSDPIYDQRLPNQLIGGRFTIAQMAELLDEGATIRLERPEDAKVIYDIISEHLESWSNTMNNNSQFGSKTAPVEDLMKLSALADNLYGYAKRFFVVDRPRGSLSRRLDQIRGRFNAGAGRRFVDPNAAVTPENKPEMPGHSHLTENILSKGSGRNAWS